MTEHRERFAEAAQDGEKTHFPCGGLDHNR